MQRLLKTYLTTVLCALCATGTLEAVPVLPLPERAAEKEQQEDSVKVSLVTFYPGSEPHNIWGHSEIRVQQGPVDLYFNYGVFDFQAPAFMWRFMVEQELNLPQDRALAVRDFLWNNAQPENRTYRYKFLSDNCSTRPRDIIEMAAGDGLQYPAMGDTAVTYRDILAHYCRNYSWEKFGIDLVLGWDIDTALDQRATMFIPMLLMDAVAGATITTDSITVPLVKATTVPIDKSTEGNVRPPTPWYFSPIAMAILVLALTLLVSQRDWRRRNVSRCFDTILFTVGGLAGCILFFLIFFSTHEATSPNINIVWLHPLLLLLAVLPWFKKTRKAARWLHALNALVVALLMLAWPWQPQVGNIAFFPLMASLVVRSLTNVWLLGKPTRGPTSSN